MNVVETNKLSVGYGRKTVLEDISIPFKRGKFISLLGPNGAGKTTLLRTMSKHLPIVSGNIEIIGKDLLKTSVKELAKKVSVVLTNKTIPPLFTVFDFVALGRYPHTDLMGNLALKDKEIVIKTLKDVNAIDLKDRDLSTLSDGERQKVLIARALAQQPSIILLDEPTMHLDLKHRMEVMTILRKLCVEKGITVIASLHDIDIAAKISDIVLLVKDGEIAQWGAPEKILDDKTVSSLYSFESAGFNKMLGSVEIKGSNDGKNVFVAGGMGSSSVLIRLLSRKGYQITTGIMHKNDIDAIVASSIGAKCHTVDSTDEISILSVKKSGCLESISGLFIDTGFPVGRSNRGNIEILKEAQKYNRKIYTLRGRDEAKKMYKNIEPLIFCHNETDLVDHIEGNL
jgi:iron complex transport system ATP-binding protein